MARILLVDDEPRIVMFLEKGLRQQNHEAESALNGRQALEMALSKPFDLMVLDLSLPELDGFGVLKHLRAVNKSLPVMVITARGEADCIRAISFGADDCLHKPFRFGELLPRVRRLLGEGLEPSAESRAY
ncbi:response regulator transcription factor [Leptothoe spongobia]|uniref:Response regulator transcription factor n=1 Tax=Leptothoe spongobia TAU-MAC 1115 TaxID=1967444 RepID=A0A947DMX3_9CYAN|nr:response regulator transcription factor [Leptothoe spongobia]MBT9317871.1 response regulator transcription factor [Leptothoe spongobia TAU-MAC 1115]